MSDHTEQKQCDGSGWLMHATPPSTVNKRCPGCDHPDCPNRRPEGETCERCGSENAVWGASSPLWNAVMRGGSINGDPIWNDMVCAACFMQLAEEKGVASHFHVTADRVNVELETVTPSGRVWDEKARLWVEPSADQPSVKLSEEAVEPVARMSRTELDAEARKLGIEDPLALPHLRASAGCERKAQEDRRMSDTGACIVCSSETSDRSESGGRKHWRCSDIVECAVRRNARKRRPRPEATVRKQFEEIVARNAEVPQDEAGEPTLEQLVAQGRCPECGTLEGIWHKHGCSRDPDRKQPPAPQCDGSGWRTDPTFRTATRVRCFGCSACQPTDTNPRRADK